MPPREPQKYPAAEALWKIRDSYRKAALVALVVAGVVLTVGRLVS